VLKACAVKRRVNPVPRERPQADDIRRPPPEGLSKVAKQHLLKRLPLRTRCRIAASECDEARAAYGTHGQPKIANVSSSRLCSVPFRSPVLRAVA
jgi:hypothetical protein